MMKAQYVCHWHTDIQYVVLAVSELLRYEDVLNLADVAHLVFLPLHLWANWCDLIIDEQTLVSQVHAQHLWSALIGHLDFLMLYTQKERLKD